MYDSCPQMDVRSTHWPKICTAVNEIGLVQSLYLKLQLVVLGGNEILCAD